MPRSISTVGEDRRNVSMSGLLALLIGGGLLLAYWKFSAELERLGQFERLALFGIATFLFLWGLQQSIAARRRNDRGRNGQARRPQQPRPRRERWSISWLGILYVLAGVELVLTVRLWVPPGGPAAAVAIVGVLCILQGIRRIAGILVPKPLQHRSTRAFTRPGIVYLVVMTVLLVASLLGHSNMLMLVFAMMVGPFLMNGWIAYAMLRRTDVTRRLPKTAFAGVSFSVDIRLENRKLALASSVMLVADGIENRFEELEAHVLLARVPARSTRTESYRLQLMQRGRYHFGPLHLTTRFPLGFVERGRLFGRYDELLVYPRIGRLTEAWKKGRPQLAELVERRLPLRGSFHDEFHGMRDYRGGDSPRSIHWRTSARRNELTVREHEQHRSQDLKLLIDLWEPDQLSAADRERVELAISFAATAAVDHVRYTRDARLEIAVAGREFNHWKGRSGSSGVDSMLEMLAGAEAARAPELTRLAAQSELTNSTSMRVVWLTTRESEAELWGALGNRSDGNGSTHRGGPVEVVLAGAAELRRYFRFDGEAGAAPTESWRDGEPTTTAHPAGRKGAAASPTFSRNANV